MTQFSPAAIAAAQAAQRAWGCPASVTLAQYLIESECGKYEPQGSNDPFGIKAISGEPFVTAMTTEYVNGKPERIEQNFRKFNSLTEAFEAHAMLFVRIPLYHEALAFKDDPDEFVRMIGPHYATAPNYAATLIAAMKADDLYRYDVSEAPAPMLPAAPAAFPDGNDAVAWTKAAQTFINAHGDVQVAVDGDFGAETRNALGGVLMAALNLDMKR